MRNRTIEIMAGIHTGAIVAGVVGNRMPRWVPSLHQTHISLYSLPRNLREVKSDFLTQKWRYQVTESPDDETPLPSII